MGRQEKRLLRVARLGVSQHELEQGARLRRATVREERVDARLGDLHPRLLTRRECERPLEHLEGGRVTEPRERVAEPAENLASPPLVEPLAEGSAKEGRCRLRGSAGEGPAGRIAQRLLRPRLADPLGLQDVTGDGLRAGAVVPEQRRGAAMLGRSYRRRDVGVDRAPYQGMLERERFAIGEHTGRDQGRHGRQRGRVVDVCELGGVAKLASVAEDSHGTREAHRACVEPAQASEHGVAQALAGQRDDSGCTLPVGDDPFLARCLEQFAEQQRIAAGRGVAGADEAALRHRSRTACDQLLRPVDAERLEQPDPDARRREKLSERTGLAYLDRSRRREQRHRKSLDPAREIDEPPQRSGIAPVQVVRDQEHRLVRGDRGEEPVEPEGDGRGVRFALVRVPEYRLRRLRRAGEPAPSLIRAGGTHDRLEDLAHEPEAQVALELATTSAQDAKRRDVGRGGVEQRRLPDADGPLDNHDPAVASARVVEELTDLGQLRLPLDEFPHRDGHSRSLPVCRPRAWREPPTANS